MGPTRWGTCSRKNLMIVGVVGDVQLSSGLDPVAPLMTEQTIYAPAAQMNPRMLSVVHVWFQPSWIVRTAGPVSGLTEQMQRALASADPGLPFSGFYRMSDLRRRHWRCSGSKLPCWARWRPGAAAEHGGHLRSGGEHGGAEDTRDRHSHCARLKRAPGHGARGARRIARIGRRAGAGAALCFGALRVMRSVLYGVAVYDVQRSRRGGAGHWPWLRCWPRPFRRCGLRASTRRRRYGTNRNPFSDSGNAATGLQAVRSRPVRSLSTPFSPFTGRDSSWPLQ